MKTEQKRKLAWRKLRLHRRRKTSKIKTLLKWRAWDSSAHVCVEMIFNYNRNLIDDALVWKMITYLYQHVNYMKILQGKPKKLKVVASKEATLGEGKARWYLFFLFLSSLYITLIKKTQEFNLRIMFVQIEAS